MPGIIEQQCKRPTCQVNWLEVVVKGWLLFDLMKNNLHPSVIYYESNQLYMKGNSLFFTFMNLSWRVLLKVFLTVCHLEEYTEINSLSEVLQYQLG